MFVSVCTPIAEGCFYPRLCFLNVTLVSCPPGPASCLAHIWIEVNENIVDVCLQLSGTVVPNAVGRRNAQMSVKEHKHKSAKKERKGEQKGAKERKRVLPHKNCKQPGLKQPGLGTPKYDVIGYDDDDDDDFFR